MFSFERHLVVVLGIALLIVVLAIVAVVFGIP
jgi:hypothetical protein